MSGLTRSIAALAERLGDTRRTAGVRGSAADRAIATRTDAAVPPTGAEHPTSEEDGVPAQLTEILAMPLDRFAHEGQLLEVRVPWLDVTVWVVPDERDAGALGRESIGRGRVWTARELATLMALADRTPSVVQTLAFAKCAVDGDIVEARQR